MSSNDLSGRTLSHYRILRQLGSGGMGEVYLAEDTQLERTVALKILPTDVASDEERMRRFIREAKAASAIDHPNIVHVYEISSADHVHFIAMQYVEGHTLRTKIESRPMPIEELLKAAIQITEALSEAHTRGIIHRDLKPANIMVTPRGHVKLLDFGLAKIQPSASRKDSQVVTQSKTESGVVMGTVAYMSPEQAMGGKVDHRTDIFSTGVVLYEMATGRPPFVGRNPAETVDRIVHSQPESIARLNYEAPQELERIVRKCLEKDPERRYQYASEINIDLTNLKRDLDSSESKSFAPSSSASSTVTKVSLTTRRYWIPILIALALAVIAGFALYRSRQNSGEAIQAIAVLPFKNVNLDPKTEYLSDGITDSIINNVSLIRQIRVMSRGTVFTYKNKEVDPREVGKELGVDGVVTGKLLQEGDSLVVTVDLVDARDGSQIWGEQYDRKLADILSLQSEISKEISNKLRIKLTASEENLVARQYTGDTEAYKHYLKGQFFLTQRTPDSTQKAMEYFRLAIEKDPSYALAYDGLANCYAFLGINGALLGGLPPKEVMPKAREAVLKAIELDDTLAQPHTTLGHIQFNYDWDWQGTEREINKAQALNPNESSTYYIKTLCAAALNKKEEMHSAIQQFRLLDPGTVPGTTMAIGIAYYWAREYDNSIDQLQKLSEMAPNFANPYFWSGTVYLEKKDYSLAMESFQKAVTLSHRAPVALTGFGIGLARTGKTKDAEAVLAELLESSKKQYVPEFYLACLYVALGNKDQAFEWLEKSYRERANGMNLIKVIPLMDDLRSDPRFTELLARMNLQ